MPPSAKARKTTDRAPRAAAFAPTTIGNVGPGLDVLGMAVTGPGDRVIAELTDDAVVTIADAGHPDLPTEPGFNTAGIAARAVLRTLASTAGVRLTVEKGLPLAGGQGGSAASAVAAAVAVDRLLGERLDAMALLACALEGEMAVAGRHADNLAPALLGGIVLVRSVDPLDIVTLPVPAGLRIVLAYPQQRLRTADARSVLPDAVARDVMVRQMANVAAMVAACASGDLALFGRALDDRIAEPAREGLLPGFVEAKAAAIAAGALGGSLSGSGPTSFYVADSDTAATAVGAAVDRAYADRGIPCEIRIESVAMLGALHLPEDATRA